MTEFTIGARVRALRTMAGYRNAGLLADALEENGSARGLRETNLRLIERDARPAQPRELQDIADLCGVPLAWFTADFSRLPEVSENPRAVIAREMRAAEQRANERRAGTPEDHQPRPTEDRGP